MYIIVYLSISTCVLEQKTLKTRKKFSKFRKQSRLCREKVSKIKSTSNTNFEKAPISRKQTIFRIEIIYYRTSCTLVIQQSGFSGQQVFKSRDITNGLRDQRTKKSFPCHSNGDFGSKFQNFRNFLHNYCSFLPFRFKNISVLSENKTRKSKAFFYKLFQIRDKFIFGVA